MPFSCIFPKHLIKSLIVDFSTSWLAIVCAHSYKTGRKTFLLEDLRQWYLKDIVVVQVKCYRESLKVQYYPLCYLPATWMTFHQQSNQKADDILLYRTIHTDEDRLALHEDLNALIQWSDLWLMSFNPSKCAHLNKHYLLASYQILHRPTTNWPMASSSIPRCNYRWTSKMDQPCRQDSSKSKFHHWFSLKKSQFM